MTFPLNVYGLAFFAALLTSAASLPLWRLWCLARNHVDEPGQRKIHHQPIPLAGGLAVFTGMAIPLLLGALSLIFAWSTGSKAVELAGLNGAGEFYAYGFEQRRWQLLVLGLGALGMLGLGWLDDRHELSPTAKFAGQFLIALATAASGIRITLFVEIPIFSYAITVLWILTVTNACNFMDNMNGLCTGLGVIGTWCFAWNAALQGQFLVGAIAFLACGALLGFLPFNFPRASVFLGDAGSHLIGYLLALLAILPHFYSDLTPHRSAVLKPLLILGVILTDLVCVVWIRWQHGQPFYIGDTNHLSHRLVRRGFTPSTAVLLILFFAATLGSLSFLL